MKSFSHVNFKKATVDRFRKFSKQIAKTHTEAMEAMIDFFEDNSISPYESLGVNMTTLESKIKSRINAVIAIIKDIEKSHHKPTTAILQTLFEETSNIEKEEKEEYDFETPTLITENEELTYYRKEYYANQENYNALKYDVDTILKNTKYIKHNFGIGYFRLDITKEEFEQLKQKLKDVHHHNATEIRR
ncbi:MAG: BfmA/BtgA family mobilization protein [Flavobacteriaceae bacterium]